MTRPCPTCQRGTSKTGNPAFPFCSSRCRAVDLGRWLAEDYRIPVEGEGDGNIESTMPTSDDDH